MSITIHPDSLAFLAAIREQPDDDTARLVYADWLTEQGEEDRAELIRVQCEWNRLKDVSFPNTDEGRRECWRIMQLPARESALLAAHPEWRPKCVVCSGKGWTPFPDPAGGPELQNECHICSGIGHIGTYKRGWLDSVEVPQLSNVLVQHTVAADDEFNDGWRPTPWAESLIHEHPLLRRVVSKDRQPETTGGGQARWFGARNPEYVMFENRLPMFLYERQKGRGASYSFNGFDPNTFFDSPSAAIDALAVALCDVLREKGGWAGSRA